VSDVAGHFKSLLLQSDVKMTYLVPIELIQLSIDQLDFEQFSIRRFKKDELAQLTQNHIREEFYPWATLDLNLLEDYWFLVTTDTTPAQLAFDLGNLFDSRVRPSYSNHPQAVEKGLYPLVLYEWVDMFRPSNTAGGAIKREANDESFYPQLPFVIAVSANWLKVPERAPETKMMVRNTYYDDDGEEVGDSPEVVFYFDELRTRKLEEDLREFEARLRLIDKYQPEWRFVYTALGFLAKAFQTRGLEQLLWHITAIEAVLGQNREGLTKILNRRIVEVFGRSPDGKKRLKKQFDDLYGFRSDLVHGNTKLEDRKIMKGHLAESRDFARGVVAWATGLLACVARNYPPGGQRIPTRDDLLLVLDMETTTRSSIAALLQVLPSEFPAVETWLAYGKSAGFPWES
jgi:hypothetical protein